MTWARIALVLLAIAWTCVLTVWYREMRRWADYEDATLLILLAGWAAGIVAVAVAFFGVEGG